MSVLDVLFTVLIQPLSLAFEAIYVVALRVIGDPGLSIVALSLAMNVLVLPLYMRADRMQEREREAEAAMRDGVAHIRATFSGDERAMMLSAYYRQRGYRPTDVLKGSVSLALEIPFFIAAYMFLSNLQAIRGVPFWVIPDLGAPDGLLSVGGLTVNALPFVMTAVNLVSCALFTRGMPARSKVQLYGMAAFFLVFLYGSPSGLVFYWTLNNVFALAKTVFYKIPHPKGALVALTAVVGACLVGFGAALYNPPELWQKVLVIVLGALCLLPLAIVIFKKVTGFSLGEPRHEPSRMAFLAGAAFLTLLCGVLIPSAVVASSPQEFLSIHHLSSPIWFVVKSGCLAAGAFLVWGSVFYWLCNRRAKLVFETGVWVLSCTAIASYMFFGTGLGTLSSSLQYVNGMWFSDFELIANALVVENVIIVAVLIARFARKTMARVLLPASAVLLVLSVMNISTINDSFNRVSSTLGNTGAEAPSFELSREGKNVVVLMLDRGMNEYIPYIFNEKPQLKEQFAGFTYYDNVISFGGSTNFGSPALFGGYEYTPEEINKRVNETLASKHNESLKVMPVLFDEANYNVTVCDPTYASYQWIPDLSIYNDYPDINTYITKGYFTDTWPATQESNMRNFFFYSLMKASPAIVQPAIYDNGNYVSSADKSNSNAASGQDIHAGIRTADGLNPTFMDAYTVLENLPEMTKVVDGNAGNFLMMTNDTPHEPTLLQEPEYVPSAHVDNTEYEIKNANRYTIGRTTLAMTDNLKIIHYHANMATYLQLGAWLDYLREQGVYDNTRIIVVADHGFPLSQLPNKHIDGVSDSKYDIEAFNPVLMVKDFDSRDEFSTSHEFMTNADTPTLATDGLIANPVNPFTGKQINNDEKTAHAQHVYSSQEWVIEQNNGNTFIPGDPWFSVRNDMRDPDNWTEIPDPNGN